LITSLGTIAIPKPDFIREIIKALLALGKPFIWSLPEQEQFRLPEEILHEIPRQFEQAESQYLILHWAPQKLILQHPSTAVFLSHCGWNSTIESLASGVPVVAWPMFGDQMLNALDLVAKGSGVLIDGTGMTSTKVISAEDIQEAVTRTAGFGNSSETNAFRKAAQLWRAKLAEATGPNGSSQRNFMDLMKFDDIKA
jgi:UDP:flavonoid glycosyltransferase YjiC (YdhE family)